MKFSFIQTAFVVLFLFNGIVASGQLYKNNRREYVFADEVNVRDSASRKGKIVGTLTHGQQVILCEGEPTVEDTIRNIASRWTPIINNGSTGYVWDPNLSTQSFEHSNKNRLLLNNDAHGISYKIFSGDKLIAMGKFKDKPYIPYSYFNAIQPLSPKAGLLYFTLSDSKNSYSFDGNTVTLDSKSSTENINALHQSNSAEIANPAGLIVCRDRVNLRAAPDTGFIIVQLPLYAKIELLDDLLVRTDTIRFIDEHWYQIKWNGKTGYIKGSNASTPKKHIRDCNDASTSYLLCDNGLFVLQNGTLVAHTLLRHKIYDQTLHSFGHMGFGNDYHFVAIEKIAHSCGSVGGDFYYLWNGKKIIYFCADISIGDGGFSEGTEITFPAYTNGLPGKIIAHDYASESIQISPVDNCEKSYQEAVQSSSHSVLEFDGDTLHEVASKHLTLKQFIKREFPEYKLVQYVHGDIDGDNIEDVLFQIGKDYRNDDGYVTSYKMTIGIAYGTKNGTLERVTINKHILETGSTSIELELNGREITVTSYLPEREIFQFSCNPADQKIYWKSFTSIRNKEVKKNVFKTKPILFEDAWPVSAEERENY